MVVRFRRVDEVVFISTMDARNLLQCRYATRSLYDICASYSKIEFFKGVRGCSLSAILPYDLENLCKGGKRRQLTSREKEKIAWMRGVCDEILKTPQTTPETMNLDQETSSVIMQYDGCDISFCKGDSITINATEMALPFSKSVYDWTRQKSSQEYIKTLSAVKGIPASALIQTVRGGNQKDMQGTWMHEAVAMEFARWLSPAFAIWCNDRIKELLQHGFTAKPDTLDKMLADPETGIKMLTALKEERAAKELAIAERNKAQEQALLQKPKVEYYDAVIEDRELYSTYQLAGELGMSYYTLRSRLFKNGIIQAGTGTLTVVPEYNEWGEFAKTSQHGATTFKWNKLGRLKIFELIAPDMPH